jgi:hypothetical protein
MQELPTISRGEPPGAERSWQGAFDETAYSRQ